MPYESMSELVDRLATALAENQQLRADLARVTAERDAAQRVIRSICEHCGWNVHSPTCREIDCPIEPWLPTDPPHNYIGEEAVGGAQEITARLEKSMSKSPIRTNPEAAREFLAGLSMYDENGQLRKGAPFDEPQEVQDESN